MKQNTKKDGTFGGCDYIIYKEPSINNFPPTSEIPSTAKHVTNNKDIEINKELKNKESNNKNSFLKKEEIYKLLSNKCTIQDDENLSIVNNDFSKYELNLLSEYAHKRLYFLTMEKGIML